MDANTLDLVIQNTYQAGAGVGAFLIYTAVMAGVAYGAAYLLRKKPPVSPLDDSNIDPSIRGSVCPYILGHRKTGPIVGWVGNSYITRDDIAGGGKGGGDEPQSTTYWQSGFHILCLGQGKALYNITERGVKIYDTTITPSTHPSGTSVTSSKGTFRIYWGESDQPVDTALAEYTGRDIAYHHVMYVVWDAKALGPAKVWPILEYDIAVEPQFSTLFGNPVWIENVPLVDTYVVDISTAAQSSRRRSGILDYTYTYHLRTTDTDVYNVRVGSEISITYSGVTFTSAVALVAENDLDGSIIDIHTVDAIPSHFIGATGLTMTNYETARSGLNVAAIIYQLLFGVFPYGLAEDTADYNLTDLEDVFDYFDDGMTHEVPASIAMKDKTSIQDGLAMILQDCGIMMSWDVDSAQYRFSVIKSTDTAVTISKDDYDLPDKESYIENGYSVLQPGHRYYTFTDSGRSFSQSSVMIADDGLAKYAKMPNAKSIPMYTVTDLTTASMLAARRDREFYVRAGFNVEISSALSGMIPGKLFQLSGVSGSYRLAKKELNPLKGSFNATFLEDMFSEDSGAIDTTPSGTPRQGDSVPYPDTRFRLMECSKYYGFNVAGVFLLRIRESDQNYNTAIHLSSDNTTYTRIAITQNYATGGHLVEAIDAVTDTIITTGPKVLFMGSDADYVTSLVSNDYGWRSGEQIVVINDEIFYLKNITPTAVDNEYTLDGLIRGRSGTNMAAHSIGDDVYILRPSDIQILRHPMLLSGATIYAKSVPFAAEYSVDISDITADSISFGGGGNRPLPCVNLNTLEGSAAWVEGEDIEMVWNYRYIEGNAGAGLSLSDAAYSAPPPEGQFRLEIYDGATLVRTEILQEASYTYSNDDLVSDFSGEPTDIDVTIYNVFGGNESDALEANFVKV